LKEKITIRSLKTFIWINGGGGSDKRKRPETPQKNTTTPTPPQKPKTHNKTKKKKTKHTPQKKNHPHRGGQFWSRGKGYTLQELKAEGDFQKGLNFFLKRAKTPLIRVTGES